MSRLGRAFPATPILSGRQPLAPPPVAFDPSAGFPWNQDAGESFVESQCWPDPTTDLLYAFGPPLNAVQSGTFFPADDVDAVVQSYPVVDDSVQAWAVGPPQNAVADQSWNQDEGERFVVSQVFPDTTQLVAGYVPPTVQAWSVDGGEVQAQPGDDPSVQSWAVGPPQNAVQAQAFNQPDESSPAPVADDSVQPWAIQPPSAAAFNPASGFPWNAEEGERFVSSQLIADETPSGPGLIPPVLAAWSVDGGEVQAQPGQDETPQAWAITPPQNAVIAQPILGDSDVVQAIPVIDDTVQSWPVQVVAVFNPANGFPQNQDDSERFYQQQLTDDNVGYALGLVPLNAVQAQAFNQPDEAPYSTVIDDDTAQPYAIQPAFDPATVPWSQADDIVQPVWAMVDDTSQAWAIGPLPMLRAFNDPGLEIPAPWMLADDNGGVWTATLGVVPTLIGGFPPAGSASNPTAPGFAAAPKPGGSGSNPTPGGSASNPKPGR